MLSQEVKTEMMKQQNVLWDVFESILILWYPLAPFE